MSQLDVEQTERDFALGHDGPKVIVVGLDASEIHSHGSQASLHAAAYAEGLAGGKGGRVIAVWVRPAIALAQTFVGTIDEIEDDREQAVATARAILQEAAGRSGVPAALLQVREGDPFEELCAAAEEVQADTIVVGASTHRLGSVAVRLIRAGRWPVTVVP
jgi:nucleotide-binding universal stress UspA family protein